MLGRGGRGSASLDALEQHVIALSPIGAAGPRAGMGGSSPAAQPPSPSRMGTAGSGPVLTAQRRGGRGGLTPSLLTGCEWELIGDAALTRDGKVQECCRGGAKRVRGCASTPHVCAQRFPPAPPGSGRIHGRAGPPALQDPRSGAGCLQWVCNAASAPCRWLTALHPGVTHHAATSQLSQLKSHPCPVCWWRGG